MHCSKSHDNGLVFPLKSIDLRRRVGPTFKKKSNCFMLMLCQLIKLTRLLTASPLLFRAG